MPARSGDGFLAGAKWHPRRASLLASTALLVALSMLPVPALSQAVWQGANNTDFTDPTNYQGNADPANNDVVLDDGGLANQPTLGAGDSSTVDTVSVSDGTLTIAGDLTATTGVTTSGTGQLLIGAAGSVSGAVAAGGALVTNAGLITGNVNFTGTTFNNSGTGTIDGNLTVSGTAFNNTGVVTGTTTVNGGTLNLNAGTDLANGQLLTVNGGLVNVNASETVGAIDGGGGSISISAGQTLTTGGNGASTVFSGSFTGSGSLQKEGTGTFALDGAGTLAGPTTIAAGTLQIGNGGTTGALGTGNIINNATLSFNRTDAFTVANTISGTGVVNQIGTGTTTLTGGNSYTGATTISAGQLIAANATALGTAAAGTTVASGAGLGLSGGITIATEALTLNGAGVGGAGALFNSSGSNTYGGTIALGSNSTIRNAVNSTQLTINGGINGAAVLTFDNVGAAIQVNGVIGAAVTGLTVTGTGTTTLVNVNTYAGLTTISGGNLIAANNAALGSTASGTTVASGGGLGLSGGIAIGAEALTLNGTGVGGLGALFNSAGSNIFGGNITLGSASTIRNAVAGTTLTLNGGINGASVLTFDNVGANILMNGVIGPDVTGFTITGTGTTTLTGNNVYNGTTTISGGTLQIGVGGTEGNLGNGAVVNNGAVVFNKSNVQTVAGAISGTGSLTQGGTGTLALTGNNTYSGTTTIASGTLQVGNGGTTGTLGTGAVVNNAALVFNRSNALTVANAISGTGSVTQLGTGTTALTGDNTHTGGTTITNGTLQIGNGGTTGSIAGNVTNNATLAFNRSNALTYGGVISGNGALQQNGAGSLNLTGTHTYTGATTVNGGTLFVNGSIATSSGVTVNNGATVSGTGTLGNTVIASGGTLAPGNSIGTITVQGNLTFNNGSIYAVEVSPTEADRTNVTGTANLAGTVAATFLPGAYIQRTYTILSATTRNGTFGALTTTDLPAGFTASLNHTATDAELVLTAILGQTGTPSLPTGGLPANQQNVANTLNNFSNNGGTLPPGFVTLYRLTGQSLVNGLGQLSGQPSPSASLPAVKMMGDFLSLTLNPWGGGPGGNTGAIGYARAVGASELLPQDAADAYAAIMPVKAQPAANFGSRWSVWGQGYGGYNKTDGSTAAGTSDTTSRTYGFAAGADYRLTPNTTLGFALAGGELNWGLAQGLGGGRGDVFQAGGYASHRMGAAYISGAIAYAWYGMRTDRTVTVAGTDMLRADFEAHNVGGRLEAGYRIATQLLAVTPYIAGQVQSFRTPGYAEAAISGSNQFALGYASNTTTASRFELGSWVDRSFALDRGDAIVLRGRAAWAHDEGNNGGVNAVFQTLPGTGFTVNGAAAPRDLALVSAGSEYRFRSGLSLSARFDGEFASRSQTYAGTGTVRYMW